MDARVNDFLNEINEIAPLNDNKDESVWEKCQDDDSGFYYYWNIKTNEVTWDMPSDFKPKSKGKKQPVSLYIPPRTTHLFPSTSGLLTPVSDAFKIYKIGECTGDCKPKNKTKLQPKSAVNTTQKKDVKRKGTNRPFQRGSSSEDEKIVLISSYGGDSESEDEKPPTTPSSTTNGRLSRPPSSHNSDDDDGDNDADILTTIQNKAKELCRLEKDPIAVPLSERATTSPKIAPSNSTGFSLLAGYSDSDEDADEVVETKLKLPIIAPPPPQQDINQISHSTLFPIQRQIDLRDFESNERDNSPSKDPPSVDGNIAAGFDSKAFSRKKRIGVSLVNTGKRPKVGDNDIDETNSEGKEGLGLSTDEGENSEISSSKHHQGVKSGGVMFIKSDIVLDPSGDDENRQENDDEGIEDSYTTLKEKLGFLSEGREAVFPVQEMLIQVETLHSALKTGDLKPSYLQKWLDETSSNLIKLEKETTPDGWLLQWDRSHKRYFYRNKTTGENQWDYPVADTATAKGDDDDAMDICTTPPPCGTEPNNIHVSPPLPPMIGSPSPPPPPTISECMTSIKNKNKKTDIPLPPEPNSAPYKTEKGDGGVEPLPPGVDLSEVATLTQNKSTKDGGDLNDALSSFYSDIAAIESSNSPKSSTVAIEQKNETDCVGGETAKKKKKTKVKLAQGIAMKKKGVSKLVEKWKNVQMSYNDQ